MSSYIPSIVGVNNAAIAANALAAQMKEEEEKLTQYTQDDLNNFEFKILRTTGITSFKNPSELKKALGEESENGWQLVEKFDNTRIRLKRKLKDREKVSPTGIDPYRTIYGFSEALSALIVVSIGLGITGLIAGITILISIAERSN